MSTAHQGASQSSNPTNPDSWDNRIQNAAAFLGLTPEEATEKLKELGVEEHLAGLELLSDEEITPFGDFRKVFGDDLGIPIAKLRMAMKHLRGPKGSKTTDSLDPELVKLQNKYGVEPELSHIPTEQLLQDYHADKTDHPITIVLKERFGNKPVVVFKPDSTEVDAEATANYIADLEQGFPEEETTESEGKLVRIYAIGKVPDSVVDEDPLFPGVPLKRGRSTVNRVNWEDVDIARKQFVRLLLEDGQIDPNDRLQVRDLMNDVNQGVEGGFGALIKAYPETYLEFRKKSKLSALPALVMSMEDASNYSNSRKSNPFGIPRSY